MDKQGYVTLFNKMHPDFFLREGIRALPDEAIFTEMILFLGQYDNSPYEKRLDDNVSFGFYRGSTEELKKAVSKVDKDWAEYFTQDSRVYCGYIDGKIASFCLADDMGTYVIDGSEIKIAGPGCVGTLPEYRNRGIGLTMVGNVTRLLKEDGYDCSYIHFTGVSDWYGRLGYEPILRWNKFGIT